MSDEQETVKRRVVGLRAENVKRLAVVELDDLGRVVEIAGRNGQGKTSLLDAVALALEGRAKSVGDPVRVGTDKAQVALDLGDLVVTRTWRRAAGEEPGDEGKVTTSLRVESKDGERVNKPQAVLDELVSRVAFDPLRFANMNGRERISELLRVAGLTELLGKLDAERKRLWDDRQDLGRDARRLEGALAELPAVPAGTGVEEVSVSELVAQIERIEEHRRTRDGYESKLNAATAEVNRIEGDIERLEAQLAEKREALAVAEESVSTIKIAAEAHAVNGCAAPDSTLMDLRAKVRTAEQTNAAVRARQHADRLAREAEAAREAYRENTAEIERIDREKHDALESCPLPLPGLGLSEDDVTLRGVAFRDLAASERLGIGVTIALAGEPSLRVCLLRDASLLDDNSWRYIIDMAHEHDFQVWLETVGDGRSGAAVIIENGEVKS